MQITKNEPLPPSKGGRPAKYKWVEDLESGDCITLETFEEFERVRGALQHRNIKHTTRRVHRDTFKPIIENNERVYKIWITQ